MPPFKKRFYKTVIINALRICVKLSEFSENGQKCLNILKSSKRVHFLAFSASRPGTYLTAFQKEVDFPAGLLLQKDFLKEIPDPARGFFKDFCKATSRN